MTTTSTTADPMPELADMADTAAYVASIEAQSAWARRQLAKAGTPVVAGKPEPKATPVVAALRTPVRLGDLVAFGAGPSRFGHHVPSNHLDAIVVRPRTVGEIEAESFTVLLGALG